MRQIVVDCARARTTGKPGGQAHKVTFDAERISVDDEAEWILAVHQAHSQIREIDERLEQVFVCGASDSSAWVNSSSRRVTSQLAGFRQVQL